MTQYRNRLNCRCFYEGRHAIYVIMYFMKVMYMYIMCWETKLILFREYLCVKSEGRYWLSLLTLFKAKSHIYDPHHDWPRMKHFSDPWWIAVLFFTIRNKTSLSLMICYYSWWSMVFYECSKHSWLIPVDLGSYDTLRVTLK